MFQQNIKDMIAIFDVDNRFIACFQKDLGLDTKILNWTLEQLQFGNDNIFNLNEAHSCSPFIGGDTLTISGDEDLKEFKLIDLESLVISF